MTGATKIATTAALLLAALAVAAPAQEPTAASAETRARLQELAWLVGTWEGKATFQDQALTSRLVYSWTLDGHFIESLNETSKDGEVVWRDRNMIGWDRAKEKLVWLAFGVDGSIGWGEHAPDGREDVWVVNGTTPGAGEFEKNRSIFERHGPDEMSLTAQAFQDGEWVTFLTSRFQRVRPAVEAPPAALDSKARLQELAWLIGAWKGGGTFSGQAYSSRAVYSWTMDGNFLEMHYEARMGDQVVWRDRTMIGWDREKEKLIGFTFGVDGSIGWGTYDERPDEDTWVVHGSIPGDPLFEKSRSVLKRLGPDRFTATIQTWKDGAWADFMVADCVRETPAGD